MLDLFAGIGGFSLAGHWMGWETSAFVEWNPFSQKVLNKNFPNTPIYGDITKFDGIPYKGKIDIITGGFPCQPFSISGKQQGTADDRYLWPEMLRVIREVQPSWVVGENVAGITNMENGKILKGILNDLGSEGYGTQCFNIPAASVEAQHERQRIWIIANRSSQYANQHISQPTKRPILKSGKGNYAKNASHHLCINGREIQTKTGQSGIRSEFEQLGENGEIGHRKHFYANIYPVLRDVHGVPPRLDKNRRKRIKALGNAIVPQVAYEVFKAIESY